MPHGRLQAAEGSSQAIVSSGWVAVPGEYSVPPSMVRSSVLGRCLSDRIDEFAVLAQEGAVGVDAGGEDVER